VHVFWKQSYEPVDKISADLKHHMGTHETDDTCFFFFMQTILSVTSESVVILCQPFLIALCVYMVCVSV